MKVVKKKKVVSETLYQSNDGECFEYPILAKEHEINSQQKKVSHLKKTTIVIPYSEVRALFYYPETKEDMIMLKELFELKGAKVVSDIDSVEAFGLVSYTIEEREGITFSDFISKFDAIREELERKINEGY